MSRRIIGVALTACALGLSACGGSDQDEGASASAASGGEVKGAVSFLTASTQKPVWDSAKADFEKANPGVKLNIQYVPFVQIGSTVRTQVAAGNPPDVILTQPGSSQLQGVVSLARMQGLADLGEQPWTESIIKETRPGVQVDGKTYGWPVQGVPSGIIYSKSAFEKAGITEIPGTHQELLAACDKAKALGEGKYLMGTNLLTGSSTLATAYVASADPDWISKRTANETTFAGTPSWRTALERHVELAERGCMGPSPGTVVAADASVQSFVKGTALSAIQAFQVVPALTAAGVKAEDIGSFPLPVDEGTAPAQMTLPYSLSVAAKAKNPAAAKAFVNFIATKEESKRLAEVGNAVDPYDIDSIEAFPETMNTPEYQKALEEDRLLITIPTAFINPEVQTAYATGLQNLFLGKSSVDEVLKSMDEAWDKGIS
ncbi:MAG TPA: ABC transporter substrate-binding protein [Solirubrobacteraceae bacterium]|nr:ABC transporter substrate-binding protein [Solirubrobacteraceae bacterium]